MKRQFLFIFKKAFLSIPKKSNISLVNSFKNINLRYSLLSSFQKSTFSTDHKIDEKHSLEYIESGVFEVLKSATKCKHEKLNRTATLEELGFDSLDVVELVIALEERFSVNISDDDSMKMQSVLDMIQLFHSYYSKKLGTTQPSINTENKSPENL